MTNEDKEKIITTINKEAEESKTLLEKYEELKKLAHEPIVQKYLYLLNEINRIEMGIEKYRSPVTGQLNDSLANRIHHWFRVGRFTCDHKIWIYAGSFYKHKISNYEIDFSQDISEDNDDNLYEFTYNKYVCLDCRQEIKIPKSDWHNFEKKHLVLKSQSRIDVQYYQDIYYQLLYNNYDFIEAQNIVINEFNKNENTKAKTLKQNN